MYSIALIALALAVVMAVGLIVGVRVLGLVFGGSSMILGAPKFKILKPTGDMGSHFAFSFSTSDSTRFDKLKIRMFNPFGKPSMIELASPFDSASGEFAREVVLGPALEELKKMKGLSKSQVLAEISSTKKGITHQYEFVGTDFVDQISSAKTTATDFNSGIAVEKKAPIKFGVVHRNMIADTVPGKGPQLKIAVNPEFAAELQGSATGAADAGAPAKENYAVSKVWIEPGCIVCDACESIYPEVFEVLADTCIIRPNAPLDNGLLIEEAAEACPVEVIKFNRA